MSDSNYGAVTRFANNLDIIDQEWMADQITEADVDIQWVHAALHREEGALDDDDDDDKGEDEKLKELGLEQLGREVEDPANDHKGTT